MNHSKLLKYLLAPFFMFALDDEGGGAAEDRGDTVGDEGVDLDDPVTDPMKDEDDEDEDEEKEDKPEAKDDKEGKKKDTRIPLARHKEMMDKGRAERDSLTAQLAQYQKGSAVAKTTETIDATEVKLVALETEYNKLLADGEIDKATSKMTEIRRMERTIGDQKSDMKTAEAETRAYERVRYDTVVERLEAAYPEINPDSDEYDVEQIGEVIELKSAYEMKGLTPSAALQKAVKYVLGAKTTKETSGSSLVACKRSTPITS